MQSFPQYLGLEDSHLVHHAASGLDRLLVQPQEVLCPQVQYCRRHTQGLR